MPKIQQLPRGVRNCNPGNIRKGDNKWQGLADIQADPSFCTFKDMSYGIRAMARLLINYQLKKGAISIHDMISIYAPRKENNTRAYANSVASYMADKLEEKIDYLTAIDVKEYRYARAMIEGMIQVENGGKWDSYITEAQMVKGLMMAGLEAPKKPLSASRTIQGQQVAALSVVSGAVVDNLNHINYIKDQLALLMPYSDYIKYMFLFTALIGIGYTVWARLDDRKKGIN